MAAFNRHHRKLIGDPINTTNYTVTIQLCIRQCDPKENPTGICPPSCCDLCSSFCEITGLCPPPSPATVAPPPKHHHTPLALPLKISLVVLVATFLLFLLYTLYKFYTIWNRSRRRLTPPPSSPGSQENHDEFLDHDVLDHPIWYIRTIGLQPSVISAITVVKFRKDDGIIESTDCSVCLTEFQEDEMLRLLPKCNHAFHIPCIDTWLRSHTNCPLCRAGIVNNTVDTPSPEQNTGDLGVTEETQMAIPILEDDFDEEEDSELRIGETGEESQNNTVKSTVIGGGNGDFLMMRRSISLDDLAASRISSDVAQHHGIQSQSVDGDLGIESVKVDQTRDDHSSKKEGGNDQTQIFSRLVGSSSIGRSLQIGPSFMRRSISCSGKAWISRHSGRRDKP